MAEVKEVTIDRAIEVLNKAKELIAQMKDEKAKTVINGFLKTAEENCLLIKAENLECPEDMKEEMNTVLVLIETLYGQKAAN